MAKQDTKEEKVTVKINKHAKKEYVYAVGRRKQAVARVRLYADGKDVAWGEINAKKGDILVNGKPVDMYFGGAVSKAAYNEPFRITNTLNKYTVTVRVESGGSKGQLEAMVHGISRALSLAEKDKHRTILKKKGLLTRDARVRERRKVGTGGKARRAKQSPKR